ncbi:MAG: sensor histidine kinase [Streptococcus pyogenes]|nr:MAG: sensor histidine kinase [Streptococcus pyogenes]
MKRRFSLWQSLSLTLLLIIMITSSLFYTIMIKENYRHIKAQETHLLTATAQFLAKDQRIQQLLLNQADGRSVNQYTNRIAKSYGLDYVVVMNQEGIRLTHPNPQKIGKPFQGGDETAALRGQKILSTARGSLGKSVRYLVPVFDQHKQIGALAVGIKLTTLNEVVLQTKKKYTLAFLLCLALSILVITLIALRLKQQLHNLEPQEIFQLLEERNAMLDQTEAAVFVINQEKHIKLSNHAAATLIQEKLQLKLSNGQSIYELFPNFAKIDLTNHHEQLFRFQDDDYLLTVSPIIVNRDLRGYLIFIRYAHDVLAMLDQLAYTTTYASALQAQTHRFMNQMHVIYGLVDIAYYDQLKIYLDSILAPENQIISSLSVLIKEPLLASFLIGEQEKYKELNIQLRFEIMSEVPLAYSKNQLNHCLALYRFIHPKVITSWKPQSVLMRISWEQGYLSTTYLIEDENLQSTSIAKLFHIDYFKQLLSDTQTIFTSHITDNQIAFTITTPYKGADYESTHY